MDLAVWRPSTGTWYILQANGTYRAVQWGVRDDLLVPADYNGDGRTDLAVWRPSTGYWYILDQFTGQWGVAGDIPAEKRPTQPNRYPY